MKANVYRILDSASFGGRSDSLLVRAYDGEAALLAVRACQRLSKRHKSNWILVGIAGEEGANSRVNIDATKGRGPAFAARIAHPITSRKEALEQLQAQGFELTATGKAALQRDSTKEWKAGYLCAVAMLLRASGDSIEARELFRGVSAPIQAQTNQEDWDTFVLYGLVKP